MCGIRAQMNTMIRPPQCATDEDCNGIKDRDVEFCTTDYGCVNDTSLLYGGAAFRLGPSYESGNGAVWLYQACGSDWGHPIGKALLSDAYLIGTPR